MQNYWHNQSFFDSACSSDAVRTSSGNMIVEGRLKPHQPKNAVVKYWAAAPMDRMTSFTGSGLPFASAEMAYENTPNRGTVKAVDGKFSFPIFKPNSFYVKGGTQLLPPHVLINVCNGNKREIEAIIVGKSQPHRSLTTLPGHYTRSIYKDKQWDAKDLERFSWK